MRTRKHWNMEVIDGETLRHPKHPTGLSTVLSLMNDIIICCVCNTYFNELDNTVCECAGRLGKQRVKRGKPPSHAGMCLSSH